MAEHAFAPFVRILGKGRKASRSLTFDESLHAMQMILDGKVEAIQLGAFLMLLRIKEESAEELAGFAQASRNKIASEFPQQEPIAMLDWPSYAGKKQGLLHLYMLSMMLLAENGIRILCHGSPAHTEGRIYTEQLCIALGLPVANDLQDAKKKFGKNTLVYLPLKHFCFELDQIMHLRNLLGLRSPVHSFAKIINPGKCPYMLVPTFHPSYKPVHQHACQILGEKNVAIFKGESGESERRPNAILSVDCLRNGDMHTEKWPAMLAEKTEIHASNMQSAANSFTDSLTQLLSIWRNTAGADTKHQHAVQAIIGTVALALRLCEKADSTETAIIMANEYWHTRNRNLI